MCFICVDDVQWEQLDWGNLGWVLRPQNVPESSNLCVLDVVIQPGQGHDFHRHPNQEEVILVRSGSVEQWVGEEKRILTSGDVVFVGKDTVHATFASVDPDNAANLFVVLGPSYGIEGYEAVDASTEQPWASLRS